MNDNLCSRAAVTQYLYMEIANITTVDKIYLG